MTFKTVFSCALTFALIGLSSIAFAATPCVPAKLSDFRLYAINDISVWMSEVKGLVGSGGQIRAANFLVIGSPRNCLAMTAQSGITVLSSEVRNRLEAGEAMYLEHTGITGSVVAPNLKIYSSGINGYLWSVNNPLHPTVGSKGWKRLVQNPLSVNHQTLGLDAIHLSSTLAGLPSRPVNCDQLIDLNVTGDTVVSIDGTSLSRCTSIRLSGNSQLDRLIINVSGENLRLIGTDVTLRRLSPNQITWNFAQAGSLSIRNTANAAYGIPGTVLAPLAVTQFYEGLITGSLIVNSLIHCKDVRGNISNGVGCTAADSLLKTGEINPPSNGDGSPFN